MGLPQGAGPGPEREQQVRGPNCENTRPHSLAPQTSEPLMAAGSVGRGDRARPTPAVTGAHGEGTEEFRAAAQAET